MQTFDVSNTVCTDKSGRGCTNVNLLMESIVKLGDTMFIFEVFQNGLIFAALTAGFVCIFHVMYCRAVVCRNSSLLLALLLTGLCHMLICVFLLHISEQSALIELPRGGNQACIDYYLPATIANSITLIVIVHNIIRQNVKPTILAVIVWGIAFGSIFAGLMCVVQLLGFNPPKLHQETFITVGGKNETHLDVFWSVCKKDVHAEKLRLLAEYGLIFLPITVIVLFAWYRSFKRNKEMSFLKIRIVDTDCCDNKTEVCVCSGLGPTFSAILAYSALILLIVRPVFIAHAYLTTGYYRDILPSLLHTVMYCFICSEYLTRVFKRNPRIVNGIADGKSKKTKVILNV